MSVEIAVIGAQRPFVLEELERDFTVHRVWEAADKVPGEIYQIPVSSPVHNVTYVTVEDHDDEWVQFAAVAFVDDRALAGGGEIARHFFDRLLRRRQSDPLNAAQAFAIPQCGRAQRFKALE